jgi:hypothetical protein
LTCGQELLEKSVDRHEAKKELHNPKEGLLMQCTPKSNKEMEEAHAQPRKKSYKFLSKYVHLFKQYFLKEQILTGKEGMNSH